MRIGCSLISVTLLDRVWGVPSKTCISRGLKTFGGDTGTPFNDFNFLQSREDLSFYFRMTALNICTDASGNLVGMQSSVTKYHSYTNFAF